MHLSNRTFWKNTMYVFKFLKNDKKKLLHEQFKNEISSCSVRCEVWISSLLNVNDADTGSCCNLLGFSKMVLFCSGWLKSQTKCSEARNITGQLNKWDHVGLETTQNDQNWIQFNHFTNPTFNSISSCQQLVLWLECHWS